MLSIETINMETRLLLEVPVKVRPSVVIRLHGRRVIRHLEEVVMPPPVQRLLAHPVEIRRLVDQHQPLIPARWPMMTLLVALKLGLLLDDKH